jgi:ergothioneine biosynthesis protein EgtB
VTRAAPAADTTSALLAALAAAWRRTDSLFGMLAPEAFLAQPIRLRQPFLFYVGHLPAFAWNQVMKGLLGRTSDRPDFDVLFERGIDPVGVDGYTPSDAWPALPDVLAYRDDCRRAILESPPLVARLEDRDVLAARGRIYALVLEHELMHQETLLYMLHELPFEQKRRPPQWPRAVFAPAGSGAAHSETVTIPDGEATLGASFEALGFAWDNELPEHRVRVPRFAIDSLPVRLGEYLEFVDSRGYEDARHWDEEGWAWRSRLGIRAPVSWTGGRGAWRVRTLFEERPLADVAEWPASVSWAEARAFAAWRGGRLPTEAEYHRAAFGTPSGREAPWPWGDDPPDAARGNFGFRHGSPLAVGSCPAGASAWGVQELLGNGWEWTCTPFEGFRGFRAYIRTYPGYSADFFDGRHYVLKGGSWATDDHLLRRSFRNWFQPHYPYVFTKFRCARSR